MCTGLSSGLSSRRLTRRYDSVIQDLVLSSSLTGIAAQLLGTQKLRLYQDCLFLKEPGFTQTHW